MVTPAEQQHLGAAVDLLIFDCDGVLIESELVSTRVTVEALAELGYAIAEAEAARLFVGRSYRSIQALVEADWGQSLPAGFVDAVEQRTLAVLERELQPVAGVAGALAALAKARCVASSSSLAWIRRCLALTGLLAAFEPHLFSASMVARGKPAPDLFLHAAQAMGVAPARCLVIEDSEAGVQAGVAAGMTVLGFVGGGHVGNPAAHGARLLALGAAGLLEDMARLPALLTG
jgi:HAD superfamily hydrolase (TIGR01509 family)